MPESVLPRPSLRLAAVALGFFALALACSGGGGGSSSPTAPDPADDPTPPPAADTVVVEVYDNTFSPTSVQVEPGQTVRWVMMGNDPSHTVTDEGGAFNSGLAFNRAGAVYEHTFAESDRDKTFEYRCNAHQLCCQMQGSVRVGANAPDPRPGY